MKIAAILLFASVFGFAIYPTVQDQPKTATEKAQIKQTRRNSVYAEPQRRKDGAPPISQYPGGTTIEVLPGQPFFSGTQKSSEERTAEALKLRKQITCSSDAIVRGSVESVKGFVTRDDSSIYSVYNFKVADVLRGNVAPETQIEITGPGGVVVIDGKQIIYDHPTIARLRTMEYVLFLKHEPEGDDYRLIRNEGVYAVFGSALSRGDTRSRNQAQDNSALKVPMNLHELITEVQATNCK